MNSLCTLVVPAVSNDIPGDGAEAALVFVGLVFLACLGVAALFLFRASIRWLGRQWRGQ